MPFSSICIQESVILLGLQCVALCRFHNCFAISHFDPNWLNLLVENSPYSRQRSSCDFGNYFTHKLRVAEYLWISEEHCPKRIYALRFV